MTKTSSLSRRSLLRSAVRGTVAAVALAAVPAFAQGWGVREVDFSTVIQNVTSMPMDQALQQRASRYGLNVVNVLWEDTGRAAGSSIGPNISDVTLQLRHNGQGHLLPVLRAPNFSDKTADIKMDKMWIRVGNQHAGSETVAVPLREVLTNMREYLSDPESLAGDGNLSAKRDSHVLVSAQHVFVPLPQGGKAQFNPVIFNYQSAPESPAVMTLLVTREGTSATVIENRADPALPGWGQQLFFNNKGQRTTFTAERKSDVQQRIQSGNAKPADATALEEGADMLMIIQVPLKHEQRGFLGGLMDDMAPAAAMQMAPAAESSAGASRGGSDVETAVLGHGDDEGPFRELGGLKLERDDRFPVRVTIQFYKATSNGVVSDADLAQAAKQIDRVYDSADFVGSLVVPEGERTRPTDWLKGRTNSTWRPAPQRERTFLDWLRGR